MLVIRSAEEMACALRSPPDPQCGQLLQLQWDRLSEWADYPLEELAIFLIVQAGDTLDQAEAAFGRSLVSDSHFAFLPEFIERHGAWLEATFILSDDGYGLILLAEQGPAADPQLMAAFSNATATLDIPGIR